MTKYPNIDKHLWKPNYYVGFTQGDLYEITKRGCWYAAVSPTTAKTFREKTLRKVSARLKSI